MNDEELEMVELLRRSCDSKLVVNPQPVEQRLMRFARHAAPIVRRKRMQRVVVLASTLFLGTAGTAAGALNGGIRIGGVKLFFPQSSGSPSTSVEPRPTASLSTPTMFGSNAVAATLPGSETQWPGEPVTLNEAKDRYKARILLPKALKGPSSVYWLVPPASGQVTAVWKPQKDLPKTDDPRVGLVFTQFRGRSTDQAVMTKSQAVSQGASRVEAVMVKRSAGWFISGAKHVVVINDESGRHVDTARLASNTLLWASGDFTYRLEGNFTKATALRLANSVR